MKVSVLRYPLRFLFCFTFYLKSNAVVSSLLSLQAIGSFLSQKVLFPVAFLKSTSFNFQTQIFCDLKTVLSTAQGFKLPTKQFFLTDSNTRSPYCSSTFLGPSIWYCVLILSRSLRSTSFFPQNSLNVLRRWNFGVYVLVFYIRGLILFLGFCQVLLLGIGSKEDWVLGCCWGFGEVMVGDGG